MSAAAIAWRSHSLPANESMIKSSTCIDVRKMIIGS